MASSWKEDTEPETETHLSVGQFFNMCAYHVLGNTKEGATELSGDLSEKYHRAVDIAGSWRRAEISSLRKKGGYTKQKKQQDKKQET